MYVSLPKGLPEGAFRRIEDAVRPDPDAVLMDVPVEFSRTPAGHVLFYRAPWVLKRIALKLCATFETTRRSDWSAADQALHALCTDWSWDALYRDPPLGPGKTTEWRWDDVTGRAWIAP